MIKLMLFLKRKPGLTRQQFRDHYEKIHVPLGLKYVGHLLADFQRHYPAGMVNLADGTDADCGYDAVSIYSFRDQAAFGELSRIISEPRVRKILTEDEEQFLDRQACRMGQCEVVSGDT
jgi:hypothetical protein